MLLGMDMKNAPSSNAIPSWVNYYRSEHESCAHHLLAKCYFDGKEFARAAHLLDSVYGEEASLKQALDIRRGKNMDASGGVEIYPARSFFLRCYSLYLVCVIPLLAFLFLFLTSSILDRMENDNANWRESRARIPWHPSDLL